MAKKSEDKSLTRAEYAAVMELLATIHRDGGQHVEEHGLAESCKAAEERVYWLRRYLRESDELDGGFVV